MPRALLTEKGIQDIVEKKDNKSYRKERSNSIDGLDGAAVNLNPYGTCKSVCTDMHAIVFGVQLCRRLYGIGDSEVKQHCVPIDNLKPFTFTAASWLYQNPKLMHYADLASKAQEKGGINTLTQVYVNMTQFVGAVDWVLIRQLAFNWAAICALAYNPQYLKGGENEISDKEELFKKLKTPEFDTPSGFFAALQNSKRGIWTAPTHRAVTAEHFNFDLTMTAAQYNEGHRERVKPLHMIWDAATAHNNSSDSSEEDSNGERTPHSRHKARETVQSTDALSDMGDDDHGTLLDSDEAWTKTPNNITTRQRNTVRSSEEDELQSMEHAPDTVAEKEYVEEEDDDEEEEEDDSPPPPTIKRVQMEDTPSDLDAEDDDEDDDEEEEDESPPPPTIKRGEMEGTPSDLDEEDDEEDDDEEEDGTTPPPTVKRGRNLFPTPVPTVPNHTDSNFSDGVPVQQARESHGSASSDISDQLKRRDVPKAAKPSGGITWLPSDLEVGVCAVFEFSLPSADRSSKFAARGALITPLILNLCHKHNGNFQVSGHGANILFQAIPKFLSFLSGDEGLDPYDCIRLVRLGEMWDIGELVDKANECLKAAIPKAESLSDLARFFNDAVEICFVRCDGKLGDWEVDTTNDSEETMETFKTVYRHITSKIKDGDTGIKENNKQAVNFSKLAWSVLLVFNKKKQNDALFSLLLDYLESDDSDSLFGDYLFWRPHSMDAELLSRAMALL